MNNLISSIECSDIQAHHPSPIVKQWYAIYVRSKQEKKVHAKLLSKGIESSLPLKTVIHQWSDRKKKIKTPMFRGYVFVKINLKIDKLTVLQTTGVVKFIHFNNQIPVIPEEQIFWLNILISSELDINYVSHYIPGVEVEVTAGPFKGLKGNVIRQNSGLLVTLWIDIMKQGISVEIDPANLTMAKISNNNLTNKYQ